MVWLLNTIQMVETLFQRCFICHKLSIKGKCITSSCFRHNQVFWRDSFNMNREKKKEEVLTFWEEPFPSFLFVSPDLVLLSSLIPRKTRGKWDNVKVRVTLEKWMSWNLQQPFFFQLCNMIFKMRHSYRGSSDPAGCWARCFVAESSPPEPPPRTDAPDVPLAAAGTFCTLNAQETQTLRRTVGRFCNWD